MKYAIEAVPVSARGGHAQALDLLCRMLGEEVTVEHDPLGAPYLPQHPEWCVSISHCSTAVAVAVCETGRVGIDVESRRRLMPSLVERVCTVAEREAIAAAVDPDMEFIRLWTCKEAVLKWKGSGIRGYGSLVEALQMPGVELRSLECRVHDTVVTLAVTAE